MRLNCSHIILSVLSVFVSITLWHSCLSFVARKRFSDTTVKSETKTSAQRPHIFGRKPHNQPYNVCSRISLSFHWRIHITKSLLWKKISSFHQLRPQGKVPYGIKQKRASWRSSISTTAEEKVLRLNRQSPGFNR